MNFPKILTLKNKDQVHQYLKDLLVKKNFDIIEENWQKPWGGYFKFNKNNTAKFIKTFFGSDFTLDNKHKNLNLDPKILVVEKGQRLSWQYHFRRAEYWKVIAGKVAIIQSQTDQIPKKQDIYQEGDLIKLEKELRHRLIGLDNWGIIAEIWVHTDFANPSNEEDIVRVSDDYGR